ncbi:MAG TPA: class IV adenylate cyclase [Candidatus Saccharimonadia bacterium]|nr:class IV adenylate cyclase [Candidatus Saccharimonadia bacterium]
MDLPQEIEAKFLQVNHDDIRASLKKAGATLVHPMRLMRRNLFDHPDDRYKKAFQHEKLRLRDEGDKLTINYKKKSSDSPYVHELETTVGSYDDMKQILFAIGFKTYSYQESKRETWHLDDVEVVLDEWPWLDTYIEIEGPSEPAIQAAAKKLGFDWSGAYFGSVDTAYRAQYPKMTKEDSIANVAEVRFGDPLPEYFKHLQ